MRALLAIIMWAASFSLMAASGPWAITDTAGAVQKLSAFKRVRSVIVHDKSADSERVASQLLVVLTNAGWSVQVVAVDKSNHTGVLVDTRPLPHQSYSAYKNSREGRAEWQEASNRRAAARALVEVLKPVDSKNKIVKENDEPSPPGVVFIQVGRKP